MKESEFVWPLIILVGLFFLYRTQQNQLTLQLAQIQAQQANAAANNPWLTVPGAVDAGLMGLAGITNTFANLFSANPSDPGYQQGT